MENVLLLLQNLLMLEIQVQLPDSHSLLVLDYFLSCVELLLEDLVRLDALYEVYVLALELLPRKLLAAVVSVSPLHVPLEVVNQLHLRLHVVSQPLHPSLVNALPSHLSHEGLVLEDALFDKVQESPLKLLLVLHILNNL